MTWIALRAWSMKRFWTARIAASCESAGDAQPRRSVAGGLVLVVLGNPCRDSAHEVRDGADDERARIGNRQNHRPSSSAIRPPQATAPAPAASYSGLLMRAHRPRLRSALVGLSAVLLAAIAAPAVIRARQAPSPSLLPGPGREAAWRADLDVFAREFTRAQVDFARLYPRARFDADLAAITAALPHSSDTDVVLALMRLVASARVGHTNVRFPTPPGPIAFQRLPMAFAWFADGLAVTAASESYREAIGLRVQSIGRMTAAELEHAVAPYVSFENTVWLRQQSRAFMNVVEVLRTVGAVDADGPVPVTLSRADGTTLVVRVEPGPWQSRGLVTAIDALKIPETLARREPARFYRAEFLPDAKAVYIRYSRCQDDPAQPFAAFAKSVLWKIDADPPAVARVVVDLRANGGGNSAVIEPLLDGLRGRRLTGRARLAVLVGPATFSSAMMNALKLRRDLGAELIGEPLGERPNSYGEVRTLTLPNSQVIVQYSTKFFRLDGRGDPMTVEPDVKVTQTVADFLAGRDPVLERALSAGR